MNEESTEYLGKGEMDLQCGEKLDHSLTPYTKT